MANVCTNQMKIVSIGRNNFKNFDLPLHKENIIKL